MELDKSFSVGRRELVGALEPAECGTYAEPSLGWRAAAQGTKVDVLDQGADQRGLAHALVSYEAYSDVARVP